MNAPEHIGRHIDLDPDIRRVDEGCNGCTCTDKLACLVVLCQDNTITRYAYGEIVDHGIIHREDCLLPPHILLCHSDVLGAAAVLQQPLLLLTCVQIRIRRITRLTQGIKRLLCDGSCREKLYTACIVGARTIRSGTRGTGALRGCTNLLCAAAALCTRETRPCMGKRRLIAQACRREITPFDACRHIARPHRHPLAHEDLVDVAALLCADLDARRLHGTREELCASLLLHIRAIGEYREQDNSEEQKNQTHHLRIHAAPSFACEIDNQCFHKYSTRRTAEKVDCDEIDSENKKNCPAPMRRAVLFLSDSPSRRSR